MLTAPATLAPIANRTLAYTDYIAGYEPDAEPFSELAYNLHQVLEATYTPQILAQALRELNPQVLLIDQDETGRLSTDYPTLSDADTDALDLRALELATQAACN